MKEENMGRESRGQVPRHKGGTKGKIISRIFGGSQAEPPSVKVISEEANTKCQFYDCEIHKLVALLADVATGIWRIRSKFSAIESEELPDEIKKAYRHIESTWDALASAKVEVRDHTNEKYVAGMALNVIAFQPSPSVHVEVITETIKPSIFYGRKLIQRGDVIVETPQ